MWMVNHDASSSRVQWRTRVRFNENEKAGIGPTRQQNYVLTGIDGPFHITFTIPIFITHLPFPVKWTV